MKQEPITIKIKPWITDDKVKIPVDAVRVDLDCYVKFKDKELNHPIKEK